MNTRRILNDNNIQQAGNLLYRVLIVYITFPPP